jgi:hypothetical protein
VRLVRLRCPARPEADSEGDGDGAREP